MNTEQERAAFEAWYLENNDVPHEAIKRKGAGYAWIGTDEAWEIWQAAQAALQSQERKDAGYESGRRCGLGFAHSVVSEILRRHYHGSGVEGLNKLIQQAADVIATEMDNPTTATTDIDHARRIEGSA